jgi:hypothetical protein
MFMKHGSNFRARIGITHGSNFRARIGIMHGRNFRAGIVTSVRELCTEETSALELDYARELCTEVTSAL